MRSYLDLYFDTPNGWTPYRREPKPGAEEAIYRRIGDICVSMRAADHLRMPERVDNVVELSLVRQRGKVVPPDGAGHALALCGRRRPRPQRRVSGRKAAPGLPTARSTMSFTTCA